MIKGAIFDMDGTLFDTERLYAGNWTLTAEQFGQTPDPDFPYAVAGTTRGGQEEIVRQYYPTVDAGAFVDACTARMDRALECGVPEKPGVHEILTFFIISEGRGGVKDFERAAPPGRRGKSTRNYRLFPGRSLGYNGGDRKRPF